jgi:Tol biopolymer transport system component
MTKKIFAISTLVLILLVGVIFVYNFAFKKPAAPTAATKSADEGKVASAPTKTQDAAKPASGPITAVSDSGVFGATIASNGNSIYYFSSDNGQLNQIDMDGKLEKVISTEEFQGIQQILWNKPRNKAIVKRANGPMKSKFLLLDIAQKTVTPVKDNVDSIAWSGLGDKIIYKYYDQKTKKRAVEISDPDGKNWHKIADTDFFGLSISPVPGSSDISFWSSPDAFAATTASLINFNGENKREILKDRFGADLLWSPDGKNIAVSSSDQRGGHKIDLALMNSDGGQFRSLNFPTFAKKCTWSADSKFLFCAIPGNIPDSAILPNDWQEGEVRTADTFWKLEIATGKKDRLIEADKINGSFDVLNPFLSQDEKTLFFTNKADGKLYKLGI